MIHVKFEVKVMVVGGDVSVIGRGETVATESDEVLIPLI